MPYEPLIDKYFQKRNNQQNSSITGSIETDYYDIHEHTESTSIANSNSNLTSETNKRADIAIKNGRETILIDVTMTEATAKFIKNHDKADDATTQAAEV